MARIAVMDAGLGRMTHKMRTGRTGRIYEKYVLQAMGIIRLKPCK